jgi:hypothetical protein
VAHTPDDCYEYTSPISVAGTKTADQGGAQGGVTGLVLASPFGSEACEYAVQVVNFEGAGTLCISAEGVATVAQTNDGGFRGYLLKATAAIAIPFDVCFTPLTNGKLYFSINMSAGNVTAILLFRRAKSEHIQQFEPVYHATDPSNMQAVNEARAVAAERASDYPSTPGRSGRGV